MCQRHCYDKAIKNFASGVLRQRNKKTELKNNLRKFWLHSDELKCSSEHLQKHSNGRPFFTLKREDLGGAGGCGSGGKAADR